MVFATALVASLLLFVSGSPEQKQSYSNTPTGTELINATLWTQQSAEYQALTRGVYRSARRQLQNALDDPSWTAALEQKNNYGEKPPAIIVDVDETVLDNSPYEAWLIRNQETFRTETWHRWCKAAEAPAVPGAVEFATFADQKGVRVFYVTNRDQVVDGATRKNLKKRGFPLPDKGGEHVVLTQKEKENWDSSKTQRRKHIASDYRIVLMFGDSYGDFLGKSEKTPAARRKRIRNVSDRWGKKWFMLPNPMYGDWESAPYNENYGMEYHRKQRKKIESMTPFEPETDSGPKH